MPLYVFHCRDGENGPALRARHRETHLRHIADNPQRFALAGPLERKGEAVGSLVVIAASDEDDARKFFETDPYFIAGVWQAIRVDGFRALAGQWAASADV
ncbi:YciI family protein [Altererythrobacter sp. CAU 1778]